MAGGVALLYTRVTRVDALVLALGFGAAAAGGHGRGVVAGGVARRGARGRSACSPTERGGGGVRGGGRGELLAKKKRTPLGPAARREGSPCSRRSPRPSSVLPSLAAAAGSSRRGGGRLGALAAVARARRRTVAVAAPCRIVAAGALVLGNRWCGGPPSRNLLTNRVSSTGRAAVGRERREPACDRTGTPEAPRSTSGEGSALLIERSEGGSATLVRTNATVPVDPGGTCTPVAIRAPRKCSVHNTWTGTATGTHNRGGVIVLGGARVRRRRRRHAGDYLRDGPAYRAREATSAAPQDPPRPPGSA